MSDDQFAIVSAEQRPDLVPAFDALGAAVWPAFIDGDRTVIEHWDRLFDAGLSRFQFLVLRTDANGAEQVVATSNSIPFAWADPADDASLPDDGWDAVLAGGVDAFVAGTRANALSALALVVAPEMRGSALAGRLLLNMKACARGNGQERFQERLQTFPVRKRDNQRPNEPGRAVESRPARFLHCARDQSKKPASSSLR